jgi:hypothetical protein
MSTNDITVAIGNRNKDGRVFTALLRDSTGICLSELIREFTSRLNS